MFILTGGAGFIGSQIGIALNETLQSSEILVVDSLEFDQKWKNLNTFSFLDYFERNEFINLLERGDFNNVKIDGIFHMGACSSTTEKNASYLIENNYKYSQKLRSFALEKDIRFIYASSAATYGDGSAGYKDTSLSGLTPLNAYGFSKHLFDLWIQRNALEKNCAGIKFFNVFGPGEEHKGEMSSVVYKAFHQIRERGYVELFKSHKEGYEDGRQLRDFIYVKDAVKICLELMGDKKYQGVFNAGTGKARSFFDLVAAVFSALNVRQDIRFIEMPEYLRGKYQYFTQSDPDKLKKAGFNFEFPSLEENVRDYVGYLLQENKK